MAVFVADRRKLFRLIEGDKYGWGVEPESRPEAGEKSADSFSLIDDFLASHGREQEARGEKELLFQPSVSSDYILWALAEEERGGKEEPREETPGKKFTSPPPSSCCRYFMSSAASSELICPPE